MFEAYTVRFTSRTRVAFFNLILISPTRHVLSEFLDPPGVQDQAEFFV